MTQEPGAETGVKVDGTPTLLHFYKDGTALSLCGRMLRPATEQEVGRLPRCWGCKAQAMIEGAEG